ncbi:hypothetical protein DP353_19040 [Shigella flexneri]|nr:head-tail joining protein [Shigella flexneri]EHE6598405.1 hypothetical protein [Escherichia coli]EAA3518976.1 hypothetical protein [Shigella flexneri]EFP7887663.1 hypothetical protein [Shigella flexneri]EFP8411319.1 hypothetical protein [Shigella flexneri]EFP9022179.1 hypothetical protein [Shigella flexneri]
MATKEENLKRLCELAERLGREPDVSGSAADISQLRRQDTLTIGDDSFFVDRITPDDGGCCYIRLRRGSPAPQNNARMRRYDEGT